MDASSVVTLIQSFRCPDFINIPKIHIEYYGTKLSIPPLVIYFELYTYFTQVFLVQELGPLVAKKTAIPL